MRFIDAIVSICLLSVFVFVGIVLKLSYIGVEVPDSLITAFISVIGGELVATALITVIKTKYKKQEIKDRIELKKENGVEVTESDFNTEEEYGGVIDG